MKLSCYSKNRIYQTMCDYQVPKEWAEVMYNYLVYGLPPGSFFTAVLSNDFMGAVSHSHPANYIGSLKALVSWIFNYITEGTAYGSYAIVDKWMKLSIEEKRRCLESEGLVFDEKTEILMAIEGKESVEPVWYNI